MRARDVRSPRAEVAARSLYLRRGACVKGKAHPLVARCCCSVASLHVRTTSEPCKRSRSSPSTAWRPEGARCIYRRNAERLPVRHHKDYA